MISGAPLCLVLDNIFPRAVPLYYIHGTGGENKIPYFVATTLHKIMTIYWAPLGIKTHYSLQTRPLWFSLSNIAIISLVCLWIICIYPTRTSKYCYIKTVWQAWPGVTIMTIILMCCPLLSSATRLTNGPPDVYLCHVTPWGGFLIADSCSPYTILSIGCTQFCLLAELNRILWQNFAHWVSTLY